MTKIVTHNNKFHTDDVFAVAAVLIAYPDVEIVRTRDPEIIQTGDIVVDVGGIYDEEKGRFDHHQAGGAGVRENGIPYSSFGLVWKKYGEMVSGSKAVQQRIDLILVEPTDAADNGVNTFTALFPKVKPYVINNVVNAYRSTWKEEDNWDELFLDAVAWAKSHLKRIIKIEQDMMEGSKIILECYEKTADKRIIVIESEEPLGRETVGGVLSQMPEPVYAVLLTRDHINWQVLAINKNSTTLSLRKPLPELWLAKHDKEFDAATGLEGGVFCHRSGFMCTANNKETAIKLAEIALNE